MTAHRLANDLDRVLDLTRDLWGDLAGARLFMTGGSGFFGCWMLESFGWAVSRLGLNAHAIVLTRDRQRFARRLPQLAAHPCIQLVEGDVRSFAMPAESMSHVLHMAAEPYGPRYADSSPDALDVMVRGTERVIDLAAQSRTKRLLLVSSGAVYGRNLKAEPIPEDGPPGDEPRTARSAYAQGKRTIEKLATEFGAKHGVAVITARPFAFLGPYLPLDGAFAASDFFAAALAGKPVRVTGDGQAVRSYLYAADLAAWLWTLLLRGRANQAYNVGSEHPITIATLAQTIARAVTPAVPVENDTPTVTNAAHEFYVPNTGRVRRELGVVETIDVDEAVRRTVRWHREPERHPIVAEDLAAILTSPLPWDRLFRKTVLVTGAAGFLPAYIVKTILALNDRHPDRPARVIGLVRNLARAQERFAAYHDRQDLMFQVQDVRDPVPDDIRADFVIHAASPSSPKYYGNDPAGTIAANVDGTRNLLELARRSDAEGFLFLRSSEVYGELAEAQMPAREDNFGPLDPTDRRSCYAESKRLGETLCVTWASQHGVHARIVRPFHTYGPGLRLDDGRVFADFVADVLARRPISLRSSGLATRSFCYLADAVAGFFTVLFRGQDATAYNVGDDRGEISIRDLAHLLVDLFPDIGLTVRSVERPAGDSYLQSPVERSCPDISRVRALGWSPTTTLADGFRRTVASFS